MIRPWLCEEISFLCQAAAYPDTLLLSMALSCCSESDAPSGESREMDFMRKLRRGPRRGSGFEGLCGAGVNTLIKCQYV